MEQQEDQCGGSDACGSGEITLCFVVGANSQLNEIDTVLFDSDTFNSVSFCKFHLT